MSNRKYRHFLCTSICAHIFHWNERVLQGWPMLLLYCQHWHFNSVIENYISGKLVCTVAYCLMTVINQPSSFQSRFLYSKLSYCLLQCGLAWGYSCCFHFSELVTRQSLTSRVSNVIFYCLNLKMQLSYSYRHVIKTFAWFCNWSESFHHVWNPFKLF